MEERRVEMRGGVHCMVVHGARGSESTGRHVPPGVSWQTSERDRGEDGSLLEGGRPVLGGGAHPQACSREEERSFGRFREKLVFQLDPWFSNLAAHQNRQKNVRMLQSKPVTAGPQSVIVTMNFRDSPGDSDEKLG